MKNKSEKIKIFKQVVKDAYAQRQQKKDQIEKSEPIKSGGQKIAPGTPLIIDCLPGQLEYLRIGTANNLAPIYTGFTNFADNYYNPSDPTEMKYFNTIKAALKTIDIDPSNHPLLFIQVPLFPFPSRTALLEILFKEWNVKSVGVINNSLLAAIATGQENCIVVDINGFVTHWCPIENGQPNPYRIGRLDVSAFDILGQLQKVLASKKIKLNPRKPEEAQILLEILQKNCYVAEEPQKESAKSDLNKTITVLKNQTVVLGKERFEVLEPFFNPSLVGKDLISMTKCLIDQMKGMKMDTPELFNSVCKTLVLSGAYSTIPGLKERIFKEIVAAFDESFAKQFKIVSSALNPTLPFIGGSLIASTKDFAQICLTKEIYTTIKEDNAEMKDIFEVWDNPLEHKPGLDKKQKKHE